MSDARELAPVYAALPDAIEAMRACSERGAMFQYREHEGTRKHAAVDLFSCGAAVQVWDSLREETRVKYLGRHGHNPGKFVLMAWKAIGRVSVSVPRV